MHILSGIFTLILTSPFIFYAIYTLREPRDAYLCGRRWEFTNEPEPSECAIDMTRFSAIMILIVLVIILIVAFVHGF